MILQKNKGFTLVELSIVLVIIGLLIGGILAAQSMIKSAKINAFVSQIQQYDVSVSTFKIKYNALPGDLHGFSAAAINYGGDSLSQDGIICDDDCMQNNLAYEIGYFWADLSINDPMVSRKSCGQERFAATYNPITSGTNCSFPKPKIKDDNFIFVAGMVESNGLGGIGTSVSQWENYYVIAAATDITGSFFYESLPYANIDAVDVMAIDKKLDDGKKSTGSVLAVSQADLNNYGGQGWGSSGEGSASAAGTLGEFVSANVTSGTPALCGDFCYANVPDYITSEKYIFAVRLQKEQQ